MVGLFLGLLIGAPVGFTYAVARRGWSDRTTAREAAKQMERDARDATRAAVGWIGIAVVVVVIAFACLFGAAGRDRAAPAACAPPSRPPAAGRLAAGQVSPTACPR